MQKIIWILLVILLVSCGEETTAPYLQDRPTNLKLFLLTSSSIRVSWEDNSNRETGYILQHRRENYEFTTIDTLAENTEIFIDENLLPNEKYYYRVAALLADSVSNWSNVSALITQSTVADMEFGSDESFEVMTWNIEKFPKKDDLTVSYVRQAIIGLQVDVIALQEIKQYHTFNSMLDDLKLEDNESDWTGDWLYCDSHGNNLAYIYRGNQFTNTQTYSLFDDDWYAFPRPPFVLEGYYQDEFFVIINNHFKAFNEPDDIERRRQASLKLDDYIRENLENQNVIVLGDLNDTLIKPEADNVFWNFLSAPDYYLFADWEIALLPSSEWSYPTWPSHLDHILITYPLFPYFNQTSTVVQAIKIDSYMTGGWTDYEENISDHRPVAMKLIIE